MPTTDSTLETGKMFWILFQLSTLLLPTLECQKIYAISSTVPFSRTLAGQKLIHIC
jgi:hypothetical protein